MSILFSLLWSALSIKTPYRPNKANPLYKGKWYAPMIDNPAYKGEWAPRKIANPDYFEDLTPVKSLEKIVGFTLFSYLPVLIKDD